MEPHDSSVLTMEYVGSVDNLANTRRAITEREGGIHDVRAKY